jgi:outer membrane lipoprotein-sorting protein
VRTIRRCFLCIAFLPSLLAGADITPKKIVQNIEKKLDSAKTLKVAFRETYIWMLTGEEQSLEGELILESDDRFRVTTDDQVIVSDGKSLWTYSKPSNRVLIDVCDASEEALYPRRILFRYTKDYNVRLKGEESVLEKECYVLEFLASTAEEYFPQVTVWVDKTEWVPRKVEQVDLNENRTVYLLNMLVFNPAVPKNTFEFTIPEGAEVIDMR